MPKYLVQFDIPAAANKSRLYRELNRITFELNAERVGGSVYVFSGESAAIRAHVLAELASQYGAGHVGEPGGLQVLQVTDEPSSEYFSHRDLAKKIADELLVDHRLAENKKRSRSVATIAAALSGQGAIEWPDLTAFLHSLKAERLE